MTDAADICDPAPDQAQPLRDRQLQLLGELAEIGLEVARAIERQAKAEAPPPAAELALAYARVSRAVRLTLQLQTQLLDDRAAAAPRPPPQPAQASAEEIRKDRVQRIVERVAKAEHDDDEVIDELVEEAGERLDDEDLYGDLMAYPLSEIVARICKDLGLDPDWTALAEELWAKREMEGDEVGRPLEAFLPARPLPLAGEGDRSPESEWWRGRAMPTPSLSASPTSLPPAGEIAPLSRPPPPS